MQNTMCDLVTNQNIDHYFTFKHIPGCGRQMRPMVKTNNTISFDNAKKWIRTKLFANTERLLQNFDATTDDVHILLSGGLDSCITLHCIKKYWKGRIISHTLNYTGTWEGKQTDLDYARELSLLYNTEHYEYSVTAEEMLKDLPDIIRLLNLPFCGVMSPYFAQKMLPQNACVFTGDLSDELFGSYKGPREVSLLNDDVDIVSWRSQLDAWCVFSENDKKELYLEDFLNLVDIKSYLKLAKSWAFDIGDKINAMIGFDWVSIAPDQVFYASQKLMSQTDLSPFVNEEFIDYVHSLPGKYKVNKGDVKHILKEAFRDEIPNFIIEREKEGFVQPSNYWLFRNWRREVKKALLQKLPDILSEDFVETLVKDYYNGDTSLQYKIWSLFCFQKWMEYYENI